MMRKVAICCVAFSATCVLQVVADDANPVGKPKQFKAGKQALYGVWHDDDGWHLRTTSPDKGKKSPRVVFTGSVRVEGDLLIGQFKKLEKAKTAGDADWVFPHADGKGFDYRFATFGKLDGVNFKAGPKATGVTFSLLINGTASPNQVLIGAKGAHPEKAKFTLPPHPTK